VASVSQKPLASARGSFDQRHDYLSAIRQQVIADLACIGDVVLVVLYLVAAARWHWHLDVPTGALIAFLVSLLLAFTGMLLCSSLPMVIGRDLIYLSAAHPYEEESDRSWLSLKRRYIFYPAAYLNIVAISIWIEVSGGIVASPFTPVLFAFVLTAQQLGRFRLNSLMFIATGIVITLILAAYQSVAGIHREPTAPRQLSFYILAAAFLVAAICTHVAKATNYRATGRIPDPTHVFIYRYGDGSWRYSVHVRGTRLDSLLEIGAGASVQEAQAHVVKILDTLANDGYERVEWRVSVTADEAIGLIRRPR
jgi:hypothetical protein